MKTLLVIPDGVAIRNFLCTSFIDRLAERGPVIVWHALPEAAVAVHRDRLGAAVTWRPLPLVREPFLERVLRQAKVFAQILGHRERDGSDVMLRFLRPPRRLTSRTIHLAARVLGRLGASPRGAAWLDRAHFAVVARRRALEVFARTVRDVAPDVVFCTHQRASRAVPAMVAARRLGVPTATFIFSWDNLPKGRMAVPADRYLVWSELMKRELLGYYPEIAPDRAHVVGTPQFEPYFDDALAEERGRFLARHGLDPARPVLCYSGCDPTSAPSDPAYLADLAAAVRAFPEDGRPQILFRRSPADTSGRFAPVLEAFPEIAVSDPVWLEDRTADWTQIVATPEDVRLLANVVRHADLVVNVGSTMGMDFAIFGKPALFIAYDPPETPPEHSICVGYRLPHFRSVREIGPVYWVNRRADLGAMVRRALDRPAELHRPRRRWLETLVAQPMDQASQRTVDALARIAGH